MTLYEVVFEGTVREVYYVEADSEAEAMENWSDVEPDVSEVVEGAPVSAEIVEED